MPNQVNLPQGFEKGKPFMELEMFLNGKFIDSISIRQSDLGRVHELQHKMEKKHCHQLEYSDGQPQFFINGLSEEDVEVMKDNDGEK
jgi:hypothetical protein